MHLNWPVHLDFLLSPQTNYGMLYKIYNNINNINIKPYIKKKHQINYYANIMNYTYQMIN